jgi:hypothetical protein
MPNRIFGFTADRSAGLGRYVEQSGLGRYVEQSGLGRYVEQSGLGRYVGEKFNDEMEAKLAQDRLVADVARSKMDAMGLGMYETSAQAEQEMHSYDATGALMGLGDYEPNYGGMVDQGGDALENYEYGYSPRMNPAEFDEYAVMFDRMNPAPTPKLDTGATLQVAPVNTQAVNDGMYNIGARNQLKEDLEIYEPLSPEEMKAEGISQVSDTGEEFKIVRATPDVARQIVEANFGNLIGASRVVPNTLLVLASVYDAPQAPVLTDRLRLNRAPEVPKSASFPQAGGLFSRVVFSSIYPSIDNMPSFQEFGVRPNK